MFKKMLVPLDCSELSEVTFKYARELAGRFIGLEVVLLHVCSQKHTVLMHRAYLENVAEKIKAEVSQQHGSGNVNVRFELLEGKPIDEILCYVKQNGIDLILMATHGRSGLSRWAMGSVAYKSLCQANVPVLLVRAGIEEAILLDQLPERRLLVALDGTHSAESILPYVESLAEQWGKDNAQIILVRVCKPAEVSSDYPSGKAESWETRVEQENLKSKLVDGWYLADVEKRLTDKGFKVRHELPIGKTASEILKAASDNRANLIAMVINGRSGISRWAYGNTAEEVMLGAKTPILLTRP
ncbi:MAG: universal stress protein [Dehalococcoidia bacterium]|nr:universal stress protein [Dehalococcoidia bacterium]